MKEPDHVELVSSTVQPGEEIIVGRSFREILNGGRRRAWRGRAEARPAW